MGWRDKWKVHPAAEIFPMMSDEDFARLGQDIKANGLTNSIVLAKGEAVVLDGRNRLEAMERAGVALQSWHMRNHGDGDPVAFVISQNIRRRHLTKQQQADLIVAAIKAGAGSSRQVGEVPKRHVKGKAGSQKDAIKESAVKAGAEHGIGKRTIERSLQDKNADRIGKHLDRREKRKAERAAKSETWRKKQEEMRASMWVKEDPSSWQRLAKVLVMLNSDHDGERQAAAEAANKILQPMGWQLVRSADGRR